MNYFEQTRIALGIPNRIQKMDIEEIGMELEKIGIVLTSYCCGNNEEEVTKSLSLSFCPIPDERESVIMARPSGRIDIGKFFIWNWTDGVLKTQCITTQEIIKKLLTNPPKK